MFCNVYGGEGTGNQTRTCSERERIGKFERILFFPAKLMTSVPRNPSSSSSSFTFRVWKGFTVKPPTLPKIKEEEY